MKVGVISQDAANLSLMREYLEGADGLELVEIPRESKVVGYDYVVIDLSSIDLDDSWIQEILISIPTPIFNELCLSELSALERSAWSARMLSGLSVRNVTPSHSLKMEGSEFSVWILGASTGGPTTVQRFLQSLGGSVNSAFILIQHINADYLGILRDTLDVADWLNVGIIENGLEVKPNHLYICPPGSVPTIKEGRFQLRELKDALFSPSIDEGITSLCADLGKRANVILFTGMGKDGSSALRNVALHGGQIWCQATETCAVPAMPQSAIDTGLVQVVDAPDMLARRLGAARI